MRKVYIYLIIVISMLAILGIGLGLNGKLPFTHSLSQVISGASVRTIATFERNNLTIYHNTPSSNYRDDTIFFDVIYIDDFFYKWEKIDLFDYKWVQMSKITYPLTLSPGWHKIVIKTWEARRSHEYYGDIEVENPSCANGEYSVEGNFLVIERDFGSIIPCGGLVEGVDPYTTMLSNVAACRKKCEYCDSCGEFLEGGIWVFVENPTCPATCVESTSYSKGVFTDNKCVYSNVTQCSATSCSNGYCAPEPKPFPILVIIVPLFIIIMIILIIWGVRKWLKK
jgi:hypothetical protein